MQSLIIAIMLLVSIFSLTEISRNSLTISAKIPAYVAENIAANITNYNDMVEQYINLNYDTLHLLQTSSSGNVEGVRIIDYIGDNIAKFSQQNQVLYFNYQSVIFNYTPAFSSESQLNPVLYLVTTWDTYNAAYSGFKSIVIDEVLGRFGQALGKHLYQGSTTFWTVPWVLSQSDCNINEVFTQIPDDASGSSKMTQVKGLFKVFCSAFQDNANFKFRTFVFIEPIYKAER